MVDVKNGDFGYMNYRFQPGTSPGADMEPNMGKMETLQRYNRDQCGGEGDYDAFPNSCGGAA